METYTIEEPAELFPSLRRAPAPRKPRIVVVDDDGDMRRLLAWRLRKADFEVVELADGAALHRCLDRSVWRSGRQPIDAIVADVQMPDVTALDVMGAVPGRDLGAPIVLITAYGAEAVRGDARRLGAVAVLDKPIDWPVLQRVLKKAVAIARVRRRWKRRVAGRRLRM